MAEPRPSVDPFFRPFGESRGGQGGRSLPVTSRNAGAAAASDGTLASRALADTRAYRITPDGMQEVAKVPGTIHTCV